MEKIINLVETYSDPHARDIIVFHGSEHEANNALNLRR